MQYITSRIAAFLFLYICAGEADESGAIYVAIPLILLLIDLILKITTQRGLLFHLFNS